ncbi:MAG: hypothetical protein D6781_06535 [Verrucomicrobia bacterium]|nr:MAG: hypothetical protein D6781_06535 [Verrucomicrobiota bacterium]
MLANLETKALHNLLKQEPEAIAAHLRREWMPEDREIPPDTQEANEAAELDFQTEDKAMQAYQNLPEPLQKRTLEVLNLFAPESATYLEEVLDPPNLFLR